MKAKVNFKIYDVTDWTTNNYKYCPIFQEVKATRQMKFGYLIEYTMRDIFLEKLLTKSGGEASPRSFYKKSKLSISLDQQSDMF